MLKSQNMNIKLAKILWLTISLFTLTSISFANNFSIIVRPLKASKSALEVSITAINVSCYGAANGTASAVPSGGVPPYTYSWNIGSTEKDLFNLSPGIYVVYVKDANNETAAAQVTITQPDSLKVNIPTVVLNCSHPTQILQPSVTGGTGTYKYNWNTGEDTSDIVVDSVGIYILTVIDSNGCSVIDTTHVLMDFNKPKLNISPPNIISCSQQVVQIYATSDPEGYYQWTSPDGHFVSGLNSLNPLVDKGGTYILKSIDTLNGCVGFDTVKVLAVTPVIASAILSNVKCFGDSTGTITVSAIGGLAPYKFIWTTGETTPVINTLKAGNYSVIIRDQTTCRDTLNLEITQPPKLEALISNIGLTGPGKEDGTATITPLGGVSPYTVFWNTNQTSLTIDSLVAGLYTVVLTDSNGCTTTQSTYINPYNCTMVISSYAVPVGCYGGANGIVCVNCENGTSPYSFQWNSGDSSNCVLNQQAGIHSITITDAAGCVEIRQILLTQPDEIIVNTDSIYITTETGNGFADGTAKLIAHGGVPPFNYYFDNGSTGTGTGLSSGKHTVTVSDSKGCTRIININIPAYPCDLLGIKFVNFQYNATCYNQPVTLCANKIIGGVEPYTYLWQNGTTMSCVTDFTNYLNAVTITDAKNCPSKFFLSYSQPGIIQIGLTVKNTTMGLSNGSITANILAGGNPPFSYLWSGPDGFSSTLKDLINLQAGIYCLTVTDANGCTNSSCEEVKLNVNTHNLTEAAWKLYPNPSKDVIYLQGTNTGSAPYSWEILNVNSKVVRKGVIVDSKNIPIDISQLVSGTYYILVKDPKGMSLTGKFVVIK